VRVYLAGKISRDDWRQDLIPDIEIEALDEEHHKTWPILNKAILGKHDYVGPYFIGGNHGSFHSNNSHGVGASSSKKDLREFGGVSVKEVVRLCFQAIDQANMVFAWLDSPSAYGTLVEIGYAKAAGKTIVIGMPREFQYGGDMWFAQTMADLVVEAISPTDALAIALPRAARRKKNQLSNRDDQKRIPEFNDPIAIKWNYQPARIREFPGNLEPLTSKQMRYIGHLARQNPETAKDLLHILRLELGQTADFEDCNKGLAGFIINAFLGKIKPADS
jgi:hypothetical protein